MGDTKERVESVLAGDSIEYFDSIDWIQLACDLEEEFQVTISDEELEQHKSVESITEYIESLLVEV